jgi:hypothetical protein
LGDLEKELSDIAFLTQKISLGLKEEAARLDEGMTRVLFFKVFKIEDCEVPGGLSRGHAMSKVIMKLDSLGLQRAYGNDKGVYQHEMEEYKHG